MALLVKLTLRGVEEVWSGPPSAIWQEPATQHAELTMSDAGFGDSRSVASDKVDCKTFDLSKVLWLEAAVMRLLLVVFCGLTAVPASSLATFCNDTHTTILRPSWILSGTTRVSWHQKGKTRKVKPIWIHWSKRQ